MVSGSHRRRLQTRDRSVQASYDSCLSWSARTSL